MKHTDTAREERSAKQASAAERRHTPPLSRRLRGCVELMAPCRTVADVGTDHGYLPIYLLQRGLCRHVIASDLREKPLSIARQNAEKYGTADQTTFLLSDGLEQLTPGSFETLVCAGMGGDCIAGILDAAPWLQSVGCTLILQPQSSGNDLRRYLGQNGYRIEREILIKDGRFLYAAMRVRFGGGAPLSPGQQFLSPALQTEHSPYEAEYRARLLRSLEQTVAGISCGVTEEDRRKMEYYASALEELKIDN